MASTRLNRTQTAGNQKTLTISAWLKRCGNFAGYNHLFTNSPNPGSWDSVRFDNDDQLAVRINNDTYVIKTNRKFRDTSGWYHIVVAIDTTQATSSDRVKIYVNGVQETSLASSSYPTQNLDTNFNKNSETLQIGANTWNNNEFFDGLMSHVHLIDGTAYDASAFGQYDANGVWTLKNSPSVTYGTNGFFIFKDSQSITDQSGQGNNFTVAGGTLTNTEDNPSNIFATMNPLVKSGNSLTNGNLTVTQNSGTNYQNSISTLAVTKGKWYAECKLSNISGLFPGVGIIDVSEKCAGDGDNNEYFGTTANPKGVELFTGGFYTTGNGTNTSLTSNSTNDIIGIALDLDSATKNIKMYRNGTLITGSSVTPPDPDGGYAFGVTLYSTSSGAVAEWNFGNGYFGTTPVASAGTNASGIGIFEYDVPTGYTALSTKGLNL